MPDRVGPVRPSRIFWAVFLGSLLVELAWVVALPAFRGADEFDHAYKADAVAHGQLRGDVEASRGRGSLVEADRELVAAAAPVCSSYKYTGPDNCSPARDLPGQRVLVASGAASYNPVFYAVVGTVARPFHGVAALLAMRSATAVLTSALLAAAAATTARWARTAWPLLGLAVACTPVLVQSAGVAAPNAVAYAAACLVWAAALGLVRRPDTRWIAPLGVGIATLLVTHTTGLMWAGCSCLVVALLQPVASWRRLAQRHRGPLLLTTAALSATALACVVWILRADTNQLSSTPTDVGPMRLTDLAYMQVLWVFQTVAAFPLRNEMAPLPVYALWFSALVVVVTLGLAAAGRRVRTAVAVLLLMWLAVPLVLTVLSYAAEGYAWQGRYALPLAVGLPALAGLALDARGRSTPAPLVAAVLGLTGVAHLVSVLDVTVSERRVGVAGTLLPSTPAGTAVVSVLAVLGLLVVSLAARSATRPDPGQERVTTAPVTEGAGVS